MKRVIGLLLAVVSLVSCTEKYYNARGEEVDVEGSISHDMIVLGDRLDDPYTVDNMTKALASVYPTKAGLTRLEATDLYVRFLPSSRDQFDWLEAAGVELLDHPMDYEILKEGDYYHDPGIPEGEITWQYAVVDKDFVFPEGMVCEILDECYFAEHSATKAAGVDWDAVEREAFRLTGNGDMLVSVTKADAAAPSGRIAIIDELHGGGPIGVCGVKVTCNSFVKTAVCYTDEEGRYSMDRKFDTRLRYRIVFKNRKGFALGLNLLLVPASVSTLGKNGPEGVSIVIDGESDRRLFCRAAVNNAAYDYWNFCTEHGSVMKTPPSNLRIWLFQGLRTSSAIMMHQGCAIDDGLVGEYLGVYAELLKIFLPDITIGVKDRDDYASVYSTASHELAHASHFMQAGEDYWNHYIVFILKSFITSGFVTYGVGTEDDHGYCEVGEDWAYYIQSLIYRNRYGDQSKVFGSSFWFYPQAFLYMDERGLNRFKIYNALTSDVTDTGILKRKLLYLYPESRSLILSAFGRYNM